MKTQVFAVILGAFYLAGCSSGTITTYSIASTQQISLSDTRQSVSAKMCGDTLDMTIIQKAKIQLNSDAITATLNKAKNEGNPADALANPTLSKDIGITKGCVTATGKPVGLKLVK